MNHFLRSIVGLSLVIGLAARAADDATIVARVHDKQITAADIGLKFDADGAPILPTDEATCLKTNPVAELRKLILQELQAQTIAARNIGATNEELREIADYMERATASDRVRRSKDLQRFEQQLAEGGQSPQEQERIEKRLKTLRSLAEHDKRLETMPKPPADMLRMIHTPFVEAWKYHKAIHEEFGGVIASTKFGPDPVGAKAALASRLEQAGQLEITIPTLREAFWQNLRTAPRFAVEPDKVDFTPFWKLPLPQDDEPAAREDTSRPGRISKSDAVTAAA